MKRYYIAYVVTHKTENVFRRDQIKTAMFDFENAIILGNISQVRDKVTRYACEEDRDVLRAEIISWQELPDR